MLELNYRELGKRIKIAQFKADMTQEGLASALGMSPSHMSNIKTGTMRVNLTALVNIANILSVTVDDLLYDSVIHARPQLEQDIQQVVDDCDDYELRVVKDVTQAVVDALRANDKLREGS